MTQRKHHGFRLSKLMSLAAFAVGLSPSAHAQGAAPAPAPVTPETPKPLDSAAAAPSPTPAPAPAPSVTPMPPSTGAAASPESAPPAPVAPAPAAAPMTAPQAAPEPLPASAPAEPNEGFSPTDPLAGYTSDLAYLRSADNEFQFFPSGRLQVDGLFYKRDSDKMPTPSIILRRARLEAIGWVGPSFFYYIAGDFALGSPAASDPEPQSWVAATDDFVGVAPWKDVAMLQVGQFDAPFTQENRTSDKYFDFMERSITVRAFGIPSNKESGAMIHGILPNKGFYYSAALLNGDGQNFKNVDSKFDVMGRAWVAPFALAGEKSLEDIEVGGSVWLGTRSALGSTPTGLPLAKQQTQGQLTFFDPTKFTIAGTDTPAELHQDGDLKAFALEAHVPIEHKFGVRVEYVHKNQELSLYNVAAPATPAKPAALTPAKLNGGSVYGEVWWWVLGDDTILPAPGLELLPRLKKYETKAPRDGVMLAIRVEHLDETINFTPTAALAKDPSGSHQVNSFEFGVNYWHSKRYRATFNYVFNEFEGTASGVSDLKSGTLGGSSGEHEFLLRMAVAL